MGYRLRNTMRGPKKTAWYWFAKYIKLRDCIATTGTNEYCRCITCGTVYPLSYIDAGHMIPGRTGGILFDEEIVHGQCRKCNQGNSGAEEAYKQVMIEQHGKAWYEKKRQNRSAVTLQSDASYRLIAGHYREKYHELEKS